MRSSCSFTATSATDIYTLSLHDALPIYHPALPLRGHGVRAGAPVVRLGPGAQPHGAAGGAGADGAGAAIGGRPCAGRDRKSTRLNSSHSSISYAVFCLKKKKQTLG